jgi:hypothetical protein
VIPSGHPDQPDLVQQLPERVPCVRCGHPTYNVLDGEPWCLWHHGRAGMKEGANGG